MHKSPIFISGIGRSGTSAVIKSMAEHKDVVKPERIGEAPFVLHFINFLMEYEDQSGAREYNLANYQLDRDQREREYSRLLAMIQYGVDITAEDVAGLHWIAKVSLSEEAFLKTQNIFQGVKVIYVMRNGVEVVNSAKSFDGFSHLNFEQLCHRWVDNIAQCAYVHSSKGCAVIKHHELVKDPHAIYKGVFEKLSMAQDSAPGDFIKTNLFNSSFNQTSTLKTTANVFDDRLKCWNDWSETEKNKFIEICDETMQAHGFPRPYAPDDRAAPAADKIVSLGSVRDESPVKAKLFAQNAEIQKEITKCMPLSKFNYFANPSDKYGYLFIENPKVASTSLLKMLHKYERNGDTGLEANPHDRAASPIPKFTTLDASKQLAALQSPDIFKFTFVRNPYSRLLSAYRSKISTALRSKAEILAIINNVSQDLITDLNQEVSFADFVDVVCDMNPIEMNAHWNLQSNQTLINLINYDFIGEFEHLDRDFDFVAKKLFNDKDELTQSKNRTNSSSALSEFYTPELAQKVFKKFFADFENFGYVEDISQLASDSSSEISYGQAVAG